MKTTDEGGSRDGSALARLRDTLRKLYHGRTPGAFRFQLVAIIIDLAIIAFFIATRRRKLIDGGAKTPPPRPVLPISAAD
jgi:hypothetical protein